MKWMIADMMDGMEEQSIELSDVHISAARVLERTREKIVLEASLRRKKLLPGTMVAAVCAVTVLLGCAAAAVADWHGFALRKELTQTEREEIYEELAYGTATASIDDNGNVTVYGVDGEVIAELSAEEYRAWEQEQQAAVLARVQADTELLDVTTMELPPRSITELTVTDGVIPEFMLGNGHMVLLKQESGGWLLDKGAQVTIRVEALHEPCNFTFGMVRDTKMVEEGFVPRTTLLENGELIVHAEAQQPTWTFTVPRTGEYYFTMEYFSAAAEEFVNGSVTVVVP